MKFTFPSFRKLCRYLGETDALVELTELACRSFRNAAESSGNLPAFIIEQSARFGVRVNLSELELLSNHLARSYIVTVYQSAERFLHEFRNEHRALYRKDWVGDADNADPLTVTFRNMSADAEAAVGWDLVTRFQYYRIVRNWVVHTKTSANSRPQTKFDEIVPYSAERKLLERPLPATKPPDALTFDDFICFSRIAKLIAEKLCSLATPTDSHWLTNFPVDRFKRFLTNPKRMQNAIAGLLRTDFGMDKQDAQWIAEELYGSLA